LKGMSTLATGVTGGHGDAEMASACGRDTRGVKWGQGQQAGVRGTRRRRWQTRRARWAKGRTSCGCAWASCYEEMAGNRTAGYSWGLAAVDRRVLTPLAEPSYETSAESVGSGGGFAFEFEAAAAGRTELRLVHRRPWKKPPSCAIVHRRRDSQIRRVRHSGRSEERSTHNWAAGGEVGVLRAGALAALRAQPGK